MQPLRDSPRVVWRGVVTVACALSATGGWVAWHAYRQEDAQARHAQEQLAALDRKVIAVAPGKPLSLPALVSADGAAFDAPRLRGRWSLVFFGFTSCPDVCPTTLQTLAAFAREPANGVASGDTQVVFVSVDPERDSRSRIAEYLQAFDPRFVGVTGSPAAMELFSAQAGAGFAVSGAAMDHSTSVFVVDPQGRLAGVLLHPADAAEVRADLASLRG
jgi:protein SCO1/2